MKPSGRRAIVPWSAKRIDSKTVYPRLARVRRVGGKETGHAPLLPTRGQLEKSPPCAARQAEDRQSRGVTEGGEGLVRPNSSVRWSGQSMRCTEHLKIVHLRRLIGPLRDHTLQSLVTSPPWCSFALPSSPLPSLSLRFFPSSLSLFTIAAIEIAFFLKCPQATKVQWCWKLPPGAKEHIEISLPVADLPLSLMKGWIYCKSPL